MKKTKAVLALILAAALCGCSAKEENSSKIGESSSAQTSTSSITSTESKPQSTSVKSSFDKTTESEPESSVPPTNETFLRGLAGDVILRSDIKQVFVPEGEDASVENLTEENFSSVLCMGFIYASEPRGIFRTNLDNPDVYDEAGMSFSDVSEDKIEGYSRVNVGDKMCGMTLTFAETNFARQEMSGQSSYFCYGSCEFSGEAELTGYINVRAEGDSYSAFANDVTFVPAAGELPVVNYYPDPEKGICRKLMGGADKNLVWLNEYGSIYLGNTDNDDYLAKYDLPKGEEYLKCRVVIDWVKFTSSTQFAPRIEAKISSFELI